MRHAADRDLILLVDGELDAPDEQALRRHLDACLVCREREAEIRESLAEFASLQSEIALPDAPAARAELRAAIRTQEKPRLAPLAPGLAACAALVLFAANHARGDLSKPRTALTPGEARAISVSDVCRGDAGSRIVPVSLRQKVFSEYGIANPRPSAYEVDYLITPELGGADSIRNLWPQPYSTLWNAHVKDALEDRLHSMVCEGKLDLRTAQRDIATDWIAAYKKYFHTDRPLPGPS
jgi:hypothetical protein